MRLVHQSWEWLSSRLPVRAIWKDEQRAIVRPCLPTAELLGDRVMLDGAAVLQIKGEADTQILIGLIKYVGTTIAVLMGIGAIFAALNTMYSAVSSRTREIAVLRALGFGATPVVASVLLEAATLGLLGGIVGGVLVYLALNGYQATTLNWASFSQITFAFTVTPQLLVTGLWYSLILGIVGGLLPGIRAARMPVTAGLREL